MSRFHSGGPDVRDRTPSPGDRSVGERLARAAGLVVVACLLAAGQVAPDPPAHGAPDAAYLAFYRQYHDGLLTSAYLWGLAMMALVVFAAAVGRAADAKAASAGRPPSYGAGLASDLARPLAAVAATTFLVAQGVAGATAVLAVGGAPATSLRALDEVSHLTSHLATLPLGGVVLTVALAQWRARLGARWIAGLGVAAGAVLVVTTSWVAVGGQALHNAGVLALLAFLLWCAAASVSLLRGAGARRGEPPSDRGPLREALDA